MSVEQAQPTAHAGGPTRAKATLYVIPGSHACRTGMLLLEHKGIPYRTVALPTGAHPMMVRALGFPGHPKPIRSIDGRVPAMVAMLDRMGTVPALKYDGRRIQTNTGIIRFLEELQPEPPLWPADPELRAQAEEAQRWGDEPFQMAARRIVLAAGSRGPAHLHEGGARGRLGGLLSNVAPLRLIGSNVAGRLTFKAGGDAESELLASLPAMLDKIDAWVTAGVLNGAQLGAADYTIAPSLALLDYRLDIRGELEGRPSYVLLERVVPAPA